MNGQDLLNEVANAGQLAILGGQPAFASPLHVGRPNLGDRQSYLDRIEAMLDRRWLTNDGQLVQEFERRVAELAGVRHCVAMCNATIALEIVIRALGMTGEVIVPSFTFIATAHALQWQQITPVFCDVAPGTHHIDTARVEELITPRSTGIIGVHVWGDACHTEALERIAKRHGLSLLFDAAHAFGCSHLGRMIGSFGNAEVFSFHATKFLNTLEGGAVATNDDALADQIRLMRNFGFAGYDKVIYIGTNGKMNEASAAMGLTNLEALDVFVDVNLRNHQAYERGLRGVPGITLRRYAQGERRNYQYVVVEIDEAEAGLSRDELQHVLRAENVLARRYFYPGCHRMEPYRSYFPHAHLLLPETETLVQRVLLLPTGTAVGVDEIGLVCQIIRTAMDRSSDIRTCLTGAHESIAAHACKDQEP
ncbi:MAG TPA: aminotransferase class I/II-fold pyridoxal phosphate-dependent enzyme [Pirellulales bacterium]|nr:aminotransferase class I/II-fold pyridoxal phosphate-dependent enzyme [Pirellulales bacterium]